MYDQYVPGDVIPSAGMNAAINQGIIPFADAAARDAAIPAPTLGMTCFLTGSGTMQRHNGFVWVGDEAWTAITLATGWGQLAPGVARVRMDHTGQVRVSGAVDATNATASLIATLPANYRPQYTLFSANYARSVATAYIPGAVIIGTNGNIDFLKISTVAVADLAEQGIDASFLGNFLAVR